MGYHRWVNGGADISDHRKPVGCQEHESHPEYTGPKIELNASISHPHKSMMKDMNNTK